MAQDAEAGLCSDDVLKTALAAVQAGDDAGLAHLETLCLTHAFDPRLHFLRGSMLAGLRRHPEARQALQQAVEIAPGFAVARFQLGLMQISAGDAASADATLAALHALPEDHYLRIFATGLGHLIRDEFEATIATLERGMTLNAENPPMNRDMQLIIDGAREKLAAATDGEAPEEISSTHLLLRQYEIKNTRH